ncbi:MAG: hypothetical protein PHO41_11750, partial [Eubacteriales bacterium]|nr:hypothetical protein [Eubacteriales bacterium]
MKKVVLFTILLLALTVGMHALAEENSPASGAVAPAETAAAVETVAPAEAAMASATVTPVETAVATATAAPAGTVVPAETATVSETVAPTETAAAVHAGKYVPVETLDITYTQADAPAIYAQIQDGQAYLFLPSGAAIDTLTIGDREVPFTLGENTLTDAQGNEVDLIVMQSANIGSIYLQSDDPENAGRAQVDGSEDHSVTVQAGLTILDAEGNETYTGHINKLRGRGNTTWIWGDKKPYQIKLDEKADLLGTGAENKTYTLLAECFDATLLHNSLCLDVS